MATVPTKSYTEEFQNEPLTDFSQPASRQAIEMALSKVSREQGREYPIWCGGTALPAGEDSSRKDSQAIGPGEDSLSEVTKYSKRLPVKPLMFCTAVQCKDLPAISLCVYLSYYGAIFPILGYDSTETVRSEKLLNSNLGCVGSSRKPASGRSTGALISGFRKERFQHKAMVPIARAFS